MSDFETIDFFGEEGQRPESKQKEPPNERFKPQTAPKPKTEPVHPKPPEPDPLKPIADSERAQVQKPKVISEPLKKPIFGEQIGDDTFDREKFEHQEAQKGKKQMLFVGIFLAAVFFSGIGFFMFYSNSSGRELQRLLDANELALAYDYIVDCQGGGQNVDNMVEEYVQVCFDRDEVRRIVPAMQLMSSDFTGNNEFFAQVINTLYERGDIRQGNSVLLDMTSKGPEYQQLGQQILTNYGLTGEEV